MAVRDRGIVGLAIACITFYDVNITFLALYFTVAVWAFITGILEIRRGHSIAQNHRQRVFADSRRSGLDRVRRLHVLASGRRDDRDRLDHRDVRRRFGIIMIALAFRLRAHTSAGCTAVAV